jgi:hypothetical protein
MGIFALTNKHCKNRGMPYGSWLIRKFKNIFLQNLTKVLYSCCTMAYELLIQHYMKKVQTFIINISRGTTMNNVCIYIYIYM